MIVDPAMNLALLVGVVRLTVGGLNGAEYVSSVIGRDDVTKGENKRLPFSANKPGNISAPSAESKRVVENSGALPLRSRVTWPSSVRASTRLIFPLTGSNGMATNPARSTKVTPKKNKTRGMKGDDRLGLDISYLRRQMVELLRCLALVEDSHRETFHLISNDTATLRA
jgi:hypothetical protein